MRICNPSLGMKPNSASGGEVYDRELIRALADLAPIHIIAAHRSTMPTLSDPVPWEHEVWPRRGLRWWAAWGPFALAIRRCWRQHGFDVLRCHSARGLGPACLLARRLGVTAPLIVHHHHIDPSPLNAIDRLVLRRADLITVDSEYAKTALWDSWKIPAAMIEIVPAGLRSDQFVRPAVNPIRDAMPRGRFIGLWLGEFKPRKNLEWLVRLWPLVLGKCPDAFLLLAGDGPERRWIESLVIELHLDAHVGFSPGRLRDAERVLYYDAADFFLFPSLMEGFGMPVLEAMAQGKPCLVSDRGALFERVTDGQDGYVFPLEPWRWIGVIQALRWESALRERLSVGARETARTHSWEASAYHLLRVMKDHFQ